LTALLTGLPDPMIRAKASCEQDCPTTAKSRETTHTQNCGYFLANWRTATDSLSADPRTAIQASSSPRIVGL
jgi:hypothetical protein